MSDDRPETQFAARAIAALQQVDEDTAMSFLVANNEVDKFPQFQSAMRELLAVERLRREGTEIAGYPLPAFDAWSAPQMLMAGAALMGITEVAAMSGEPRIIDLCFRLFQLWLFGLTAGLTQHTEER